MEHQNKDQYFNLKQVLLVVLRKSYWIVLCLILFLGIAYVVNHYATNKYRLVTTIQASRSESAVDPLSFIYGDKKASSGGIQERILFTSFPVIAATLSNLDFGVSYYYGRKFSLKEMYRSSPIELVITGSSKVSSIPYNRVLELKAINGKQYSIKWNDEDENTYEFGKEADKDDFLFTVNVTKPEALLAYEFIGIKINRLTDLINTYRDKVDVRPVSENIINISIVEQNSEKGKIFLDSLLNKIIAQDIARKRFVSSKTVDFLDQLMEENYDSIRVIEGEIKDFRNSKVAVDPAGESARLYGTIQELETQKADLIIAEDYYDYLEDILQKANEDYEKLIIPASLGIQDPTLNTQVSQLIDMRRQVKMLLDENKSKNPILKENQVIIAEIKSNILSNIENQKKVNELKIDEINGRIAQSRAQLRQMPDAEFEYRDITRNYGLNQNLYTMLMEKKMEAGIKFSSINSDYRVINKAYQAAVLSSDPNRNYLIAVLLSLVIPVGIILLIDFFDSRIKSKEELGLKVDIPIISSIVHLSEDEDRYNPLTPVMESFRNLRADIRYLGVDKKVFVFMSSVSGEGKTFCSQNLAYLYSMTNKSVVWIDTDLRKPKESLEGKALRDKGLADYLAGFSSIDEIINSQKEFPNLKLIRSGHLPPNPAELLINHRMVELIETLKENFDYIIIDTPPINLFSDALEVLPHADYSFLLVRNKFTKTPYLTSAVELIHNKKIKDISIIFNDVAKSKKRKEYGAYYYSNQNGKSKKSLRKVKV